MRQSTRRSLAAPADRPGRLRSALLSEVAQAALLAMPLVLGLGVAHPGEAIAQGVTLSGIYATTRSLTGFSTATNPLTVKSGGAISVTSGYGIYRDQSSISRYIIAESISYCLASAA
jgi:hypothetical protein